MCIRDSPDGVQHVLRCVRRTDSGVCLCIPDIAVHGRRHGSRGGECAEVTAGIACCNPTRQLQKGAFPMVGAGIAVLTGIGAGLGIGKATSSAVDAIARQPEAESKISKSLLLGCALAEATAIYGFVIALLIILFLK